MKILFNGNWQLHACFRYLNANKLWFIMKIVAIQLTAICRTQHEDQSFFFTEYVFLPAPYSLSKVMATEPTESEPTPFTLNYTKRTIFRFIRKGTVEEPFPTEISCKDPEEYKRSSEKKMRRKKRIRGPPDFFKDENGMIIYREGPEGNNLFQLFSLVK